MTGGRRHVVQPQRERQRHHRVARGVTGGVDRRVGGGAGAPLGQQADHVTGGVQPRQRENHLQQPGQLPRRLRPGARGAAARGCCVEHGCAAPATDRRDTLHGAVELAPGAA